MSARPCALFLMGPTASGKTGLALSIARRFPVELINVDSAQIYRGMDIGTAKPDAETRARYPHRLMDILDPADRYSAARFREDALREMEAIIEVGRIPLLVGGTGLYFRALERGLADMPGADPEIRAGIDALAAAKGWAAVHAALEKVDPASAARIGPNDPQRLQRALEVYRITGKSIQDLWQAAELQHFPYRILKLGVAPSERSELHRRIEARFSGMMASGFLDEVRALKSRGDLSADLPSMRSVGYRQLWEHLEGAFDLDEAARQAIVASRRYAKRQMTWFRAEPGLEWLNSTEPDFETRAARKISEFLDD